MATSGDTDADSAALLSASEAANKEGTVQDIIDNEVQAVANNQLTATQKNPPPIPNPKPTGDSTNVPVTPSELATYLAGADIAAGALADDSEETANITNAWNYLVDQVEDVFAGIEGTLEGVTATGFGVATDVSIAEIAAGTTAEIGGIEVVAFGVALVLAQYVIGWILQQVGHYFPNPSILGWHPLDFLQVGITDLGNNLAGAAENEAEYVINVIMQPVRMLTGLFQRIVNAVAGAHDKTARIVQDTVPSAITTAQNYTDAQLKSQQDAVNDAAQQALTVLATPPTLAQAYQILADAQRYGTLVWQFEAVAAAAIIAAGQYTDDTKTQTAADIATAKAQAETDATNAINNLQSALLSRLSGDEATLSALSSAINTQVPAEIASAVATAQAAEDAKITGISNTLQAQITSLQDQLNTLANENATATASIATAQQNIATLQSQDNVDEGAIAEQEQIVATAQTTIATNTTAISDLYTQITGISDTLAPIQATQQLQASQISGINTDLELAIPTAIATISAGLQALKTEVDNCSVQTCDSTSPRYLKNALLALLALLTDAAEIGFVAEAIRDPLGTANALAPILDSIDASGLSALNLLLEL